MHKMSGLEILPIIPQLTIRMAATNSKAARLLWSLPTHTKLSSYIYQQTIIPQVSSFFVWCPHAKGLGWVMEKHNKTRENTLRWPAHQCFAQRGYGLSWLSTGRTVLNPSCRAVGELACKSFKKTITHSWLNDGGNIKTRENTVCSIN